MITRAGCVRTVVMTAAVVAVPVLWSLDEVGGGKYDPQILNRTLVVTPKATEVVVADLMAIEFGDDDDQRELPRVISNSLGAPTLARGFPWSLGDKGFELSELPIDDRGETSMVTIRGGDAGTPVTSILVFTLPAVTDVGTSFEYEVISGGGVLDALDITVYVQGVDLSEPWCRVASGTACDVTRVGEHYEAHLSSLGSDDAVTIGGTATAVFEATEDLEFPDDAEPREPMEQQTRWTIAGVLSLIGLAVGRVHAGRKVDDRRAKGRRDAMAVPLVAEQPILRPEELPAVEPWMATVLWNEVMDLRVVRAWLAQQVAADVLRVDGENNSRFAAGARLAEADLGMAGALQRMVGPEGFAPPAPNMRIERVLWLAGRRLRRTMRTQTWWHRFGPGAGHWFSWQLTAVVLGWVGVLAALIETGWSHSWLVTIALLVLVPATVAGAAVWFTAPRANAMGNEVGAELVRLRAFLHAVTVPDVHELWRGGQLTEWCVWAVAMGAADRWYLMVKGSDIPADERLPLTAPLAVGRTSGSWILTAA